MSDRGLSRERAVRLLLEDEDWVVARCAGSLGAFDLMAMHAERGRRLVEVKSTAQGPYERFGPAERARIRFAAELAGAEAWLCWWPPRGDPRWIAEREWPLSSGDPTEEER
jgi:Holliday junction resolvase